jgi:hypothetical protein
VGDAGALVEVRALVHFGGAMKFSGSNHCIFGSFSGRISSSDDGDAIVSERLSQRFLGDE